MTDRCLAALLVAGMVGCGAPDRLTIDEPWADVEVPAGLEVPLRAGGTGAAAAAEVAWDFGDGHQARGTVASHAFPESGTYTITALIRDSGRGQSVQAKSRTIVAVPAAVPGNYALRLTGTGRDDIDRAKIRLDDPSDRRPGPPADVGAGDFTLELWLRAEPGANASRGVTCGANVAWIEGNIILDRDRYGQDRKFGLSLAGGRLVFGISGDGTGDLTVCGQRQLDDGQWHHVAVTRERSSGAIMLFVDGAVDGAADVGPAGDVSYPDDGRPQASCGGPCDRSDPFLVIGAEKHDVGPEYPSFRGDIDELRVSTIRRYRGAFAVPAARFEADAATAALYHFDEGAGTLALDSARLPGGPSHAVLRRSGPGAGPVWIPSGAPTGPASP